MTISLILCILLVLVVGWSLFKWIFIGAFLLMGAIITQILGFLGFIIEGLFLLLVRLWPTSRNGGVPVFFAKLCVLVFAVVTIVLLIRR